MAFTRPRAAQIDFDVTNISDPLIRLNSAETGSADKDVGIVIERGDDTNVAVLYDESADQFVLVNTTEDGSTSGNVTISSYAGLQANAIVYGSLNDGTTTLTATVAELNILDGVTATATELNYVSGVTSAIQTQIDNISSSFTLAADSGTNDTFTTGETLTIAGGTGIDTTVSDNNISVAIDSTVATLTGTQTLTNKTLTSPNMTSPAIGGTTITATAAELNYLDGVTGITLGSANELLIVGSDGTSGQALTTDGAGNFTFTTIGGGGGGSYSDSDVSSHLNVSGASTNEILSWNGSDFAWVADATGGGGSSTFAGLTEIALADLDVHDIAVPATSVHVMTPNGSSSYRSDIHGTTDNPTIYVNAGETIAFDLTGVTGSHPFEIRSDASTAYNTGLIHIAPDGTRTTGSSAQGKTSGTLYWKVPGSINGTYKYRCTNHSGMIGDIIIDDPSADLDSAAVIGLIDSDYVQLRQDYAYASLTGTPNVLDSADVSTIAGSISGLDAAGVTALVDSDYVQLRQDYAYASLTGSPNVLDSADVSLIAGSSAGVDSATVLGLIDSAHVQLRQDYAYASLTGAPNVLDSADVSLIAGEAGLDSALSIQLIDAKIQVLDIADIVGSSGNSGQYLKSLGSGDAEWANVLDSADVSLIAGNSAGVDSATVLGLIDSAHVQLRHDYAYASLTGVPNVLDSADVSLIAGSSAGVDSAYVTTQIDALIDGAPGALNTLNELAAAINDDSQAYNTLLSLVNTKIDSADAITLITTTVDSAYVQLSAIGLPYSSLTGAPTLLDSALAQSLIDATAQTQDISDIVGAEGNSGEFLKSLGGGNATWVNISTVVDSAYVQLSAIGLPYTSLTGTPNVLDSADVSAIADSAYVLGLIDSAHVQLSAIGLPYTSLTGVPNVLDSADVSLIAGNAGTDSATVLGLIDSAHVQLRQDYAYASLTGAPGAGLDSALSQSLIDATVQVLDISDIVGAEGTSGQYLKSLGSGNAGWESFPTTLDSALTTQLIDSAYVQLSAIGLPYSSLTATPNLIDSALTTQLIDSAYVQLRSGGGGGGLSAWVEKTDAYTLVAGDRIVLDTRDSALSLTLPASPTFSDEVSIMDGTNYAATNNVTISGNGKKILASDSDFVINIDRASIDLMFYNDSQGWILTKAI